MKYNEDVGINLNESMNKYKKLISKAANRSRHLIRNSYMSSDDLLQIACTGYIKAYNDFDIRYKTKFSTYATNMINWELSNSLRGKNTIVKFPRYFIEIWTKALKNNVKNGDIKMLEKLRSDRHSDDQIIEAMNYLNFSKYVSLDTRVSIGEKRGMYYYDIVTGYNFDESEAVVSYFIKELNDREGKIVELLLLDRTQKEIADELEISLSTVIRTIKKIQCKWIELFGGVNE